MKARALSAAVLGALALAAPLAASAQAEEPWRFSIMPYLWVPSIDGKINYGPPPAGGSSANVSVDADTLLDNLAFAFMINGEARKGRWFIGTDVIYLDLHGADSAVRSVDFNFGGSRVNVSTTALNASVDTKFKGWIWTTAGGYAAIAEPRWNLDAFGGFRLLALKVETDYTLTATVTGTGPQGNTATFARTGSPDASDSIWAGIVGAKGRVKLGEGNWFVNYYADIGGWSDLFTWQGAAGIGYAFKWGEVLFDYRYLYYSQSGNDKLFDNLHAGGFALGVNFRF